MTVPIIHLSVFDEQHEPPGPGVVWELEGSELVKIYVRVNREILLHAYTEVKGWGT